MPTTGKLYLIPTTIAEGTQHEVIPPQARAVIATMRFFLAEDIRTARRYFSSLKVFDSIESLQFDVLNKETKDMDIPRLLKPLLAGNDLGLVSESGCPGVADPGSKAVAFAHQQGIRVVPLVGPSSLLLALMASGLNGQQFAFHGYLPIEPKELTQKVKELEKESKLKSQTQLFIETPYRNNSLFDNLLKTLSGETLLTAALELTGTGESVQTKAVFEWRKQTVSWPKEPMVFLFLA
jgi:16S rRNA (cytidine1402-2'-O)-methyltransferase